MINKFNEKYNEIINENKINITKEFKNYLFKYIKNIKSIETKSNYWIIVKTKDNYYIEMKLFNVPSSFGINDDKISKLYISKNNKVIVNYDRGWDIKPKEDNDKKLVDELVLNITKYTDKIYED